MKKLNKKGFTLIELLAVIVLMGILMFVAIPAVSRTIENSRKDTFKDTARQYANQVKTLWAADGLECGLKHTVVAPATYSPVVSTAVADGVYLVPFASDRTADPNYAHAGEDYTRPILLESGGKSSWANAHVTGIVEVTVVGSHATFRVAMKDSANRGIYSLTDPDRVKRNQVVLAMPAAGSIGAGITFDANSKMLIDATDYPLVAGGPTFNGICEEV